jgi:RNA polymerase-binding transcription factor DksA
LEWSTLWETNMDMLAREAREALLQRSHRLRARAGGSEEAGGIRLTDADLRELRDIESALARIDQGEFGRCGQCGGAIGRHRLRAVPEARHCLTCAAVERERAAQP